MPPPVFRYDFLIEALKELGIHHLERLPNGHVRWGDKVMEKPYTGKSIPTAPLGDNAKSLPKDTLFDMWSVEAILNKFGKTIGEFSKVYFKQK